MSSRRYWYTVMVLALLYSGSIVLLSRVGQFWPPANSPDSSSPVATAPRPGFMAPDFSLPVLGTDARQVSLRGYRGNRPVVVNFWATWCPPCRAEMPALENAYQKYQDRGLVVIGVNQMEPAYVVQPFVSQHKLTFPVLLDEESAAADVYRIRALPTTVFIRKDGTILDIVVGGPMNESFIERKMRALLPAEDNPTG